MNLLGPGASQQLDDVAAGGPADNRIVDHNHPLTAHRLRKGVELDSHRIFPLALARLDEGPADIAVLDKADPIWNAGSLCEAKRRIEAGIRHADDNIRLDGMLLPEQLAGAQTGCVHRSPLDHRIRAGEIDEFKDAEALRAAAVGPD